MKSPFTGGEVVLLSETRKSVFRKEEYEHTYLYYQCADTEETFTTTQLDTVNTLQIYNQYRTRYDIPFPDEIRAIRKSYELSAAKMSQILGFGDNQYRLYENGEIPNIANGRVLRAIQSSQAFETFVEAAKNLLSNDDYMKIKRHLNEHKAQEWEKGFMTHLIYGDTKRDEYNGYAMLSISKLKNIMLFFIEKFNGVFVTQMNKLLFYTDFLSYREYGQAMTGLAFKAIQYGPVPNRWDKVYSLIDDIEQVMVESKNGNIGNKIISDISYDQSSLTEEQSTILNKVYHTFKNDTPASISQKSHTEEAWINNNATNTFINFKYAFSLKAI